MATFGSRLRMLRKENKKTQKELASIFNVSESSIGMYERDEREPSHKMLKSLSDYFDVSFDFLLARTNVRNNYLNPDELTEIPSIEELISPKANEIDYNSIEDLTDFFVEYELTDYPFAAKDLPKWQSSTPYEMAKIKQEILEENIKKQS